MVRDVEAVVRSPGEHRLARAIRVLIIATIVSNLVYLAALLLPGDPAPVLIDIWLSLIAQWTPVGVFWLVAVRTRFALWEVILAAAAMTFNAAAETYFVLAMDATGYLPSPSLADPGYLLFYPLTTAALIVLVRRQSRNSTRVVLFDSALAMLGATAVLAVVLVPAFSDATTATTPLDGIIAALYPLFDILLVATLVGISASPALRVGPRWQFFVLGVILITGADIAYFLLVDEGAYVAGTPLDAAWPAGGALIALWVIGVDRLRAAPPSLLSGARTLPIPAFAVLAGLGVLLFATTTEVPVVALALASAAVALSAVAVLFRHAHLSRLLEGQALVVAQLTELDKAKTEMIGTVSHEMRTPLTSVLGYLELVLDDAGDGISDESKEMLRVADRNARRLENLVGDMLVMTQLSSGVAPPLTAPTDVARLLRRVIESLQPVTRGREVELSLTCDDTVVVEGDEGQLERAFTNVIENALKFTPAGGRVDVVAALGDGIAGSPSVVITVSDTGLGIPEDELPHLFDRFFRATNARENVVPGTGLGLAIVRGIVQAHEGDVAVTSVLGEGTTFVITLPLKRAEVETLQ